MIDNGCHQLEEEIENEAIGLKQYLGLEMSLCYSSRMDDRNNASQLHTISPSVLPADYGLPPANHGIPPADHGTMPASRGIPSANHGIPLPPPSRNKSKMLPLPTPSTKGKEKAIDGSNVGELVMDLAKNGAAEGTSTPTEEVAGTTPPALTDKVAGSTSPAPTGKDVGTSTNMPTELQQKGMVKPDWPPTPNNTPSSSTNYNLGDEECESCFLGRLCLYQDCNRMLDNEM